MGESRSARGPRGRPRRPSRPRGARGPEGGRRARQAAGHGPAAARHGEPTLGPGRRPPALAPAASVSHRHDGRCTRGAGQEVRGLICERRVPAQGGSAHFAAAAAAAFAALTARAGAPGAPSEPTRAPDAPRGAPGGVSPLSYDTRPASFG